MLTTLLIAAPIALTIHMVRGRLPQLRSVWAAAKWYERAGMLLLLVPIPGPVDEIVALLVIARVSRRMKGRYDA